jgi:hypothetical protein
VASPWGSGDVDATRSGMEVTVAGQGGGMAVNRSELHHDGDAVTVVWRWTYAGAPQGSYTILLRAENSQGTGRVTFEVPVQVGAATLAPQVPCDADRGAAVKCAPTITAPARSAPSGGIPALLPILVIAGLANRGKPRAVLSSTLI